MSCATLVRCIYIPLCAEDKCHQWLLRIGDMLKKKNMKVESKHPINNRYQNWFDSLFAQCDFAVIHRCPSLWKKFSSENKKNISDAEDKLILLTIRPLYVKPLTDDSQEMSINTFFDIMDSEQIIINDADIEDFVGSVMQARKFTEFRVEEEEVEDLISEYDSSIFPDSPPPQYTSISKYSAVEVDQTNSEKFVKYPDIVGNVNYVNMFVRKCDIQDESPVNFEYSKVEELIKQTNRIMKDSSKDVTHRFEKFIFQRFFPKVYEENDVVALSSIIVCEVSHFQDRALTLLELLLWQREDFRRSLEPITDLINMELYLNAALSNLKDQHLERKDQESLSRFENASLVYLMLLCHFVIASKKNAKAKSSKDFIKAIWSPESFVKWDSVGKLHDNVKEFLTDIKKSEETCDVAESILLQLEKSQTEYKPKSLLKEKVCVQALVMFQILKKVFALDIDALNLLKEYIHVPKPNRPKLLTKKGLPLPPLICTSMVFHGLSLFLTYGLRKAEHKDVHKKCQEIAMEIISEAYVPNEAEGFLLKHLFDSKDTVRQMTTELFKKKQLHSDALNHSLKAVQQSLFPLVTDLGEKPMSPYGHQTKVKSVINADEKAGTWKTFQGKFSNQEVHLVIHHFVKEDHYKSNVTFFKENEDSPFNEMQCLMKLKHEYIIEMLAYQNEKIPQFYILEGDQQTLQVMLKNKRDNQHFYTPEKLCSFVDDALSGLQYCHGQGYVHRNLTADSLCVFNESTVKLCGFWLCRKLPSTEVAVEKNSRNIPLLWSAPESIMDGEYTKASDVWMVGHLIYEVMTHGLMPYSNLDLNDEKLIKSMKEHKLHLLKEPQLSDGTFELIQKCAVYEKDSRPYIGDVKANLEEIKSVLKSLGPKAIYPPIDNSKQRKSSTKYLKGVPAKLRKDNSFQADLIRSSKHRVVYVTDTLNKFIVDGKKICFEQKMFCEMSQEMRSLIHSKELEDILPRLTLHSNSEHLSYTISIRCQSFYDMALKKDLGDNVDRYIYLLYQMATNLKKLHDKQCIFGDIPPSQVYVDKKKLKTHIVSMAYLKYIGVQEAKSPASPDQPVEITPERQSCAAPEVIKHRQFSPASDVFCFGNFMWVILTAFDQHYDSSSVFQEEEIKPFANMKPEEHLEALMTENWDASNKKPECCPDDLYRLILECVNINEKKRPTVQQIAEHLKRFSGTIAGPNIEDECREREDSSATLNSGSFSASTTFYNFDGELNGC